MNFVMWKNTIIIVKIAYLVNKNQTESTENEDKHDWKNIRSNSRKPDSETRKVWAM